jgi:O-antigen ligase
VPRGVPVAVVAFAAILLLGGQNGGFLADTWGWAALPLLLLVAGVVAVRRSIALTRLEAGLLLALAALTIWTALSALWAPTAGPPVLEAERALLYLAAIAAVLFAGARDEPEALAHGVLAAALVICTWALAGRAFGHHTSRLEGPIGYSNGLGLIATIGALLALGLALRRPPAAALTAIFLPTLALTYSRGALIALAAGVVVLVALLARSRRRVLVALGVALVLAAVAVLALGHHGGAGSSGGRLASLSGNGRGDYWRVALDETRAHPVLGGGAGTWGRWWLGRRPDANGALDAHELYLETLGELGPLGVLLLLAALAVPALALGRAVHHPGAPAWAAAYAALLAQFALDWDWELPAVTLCGLYCGAALVAGAGRETLRPIAGTARAGVVAAAAAAAAAVFVLQVGNSALSSASSALDADRVGAAARDARRADRWQPWSTQPRLLRGEARLAAGSLDAAAADFSAVLRRDPRDPDAWYQLALATTGPRHARARARALALDPHGPASVLP